MEPIVSIYIPLTFFLSFIFIWDLHSTRIGWSGWSVRGGARAVGWCGGFLFPGEEGVEGEEEARFAFLCVMGWVVDGGWLCM